MIGLLRALFVAWLYGSLGVMMLLTLPTTLGPQRWTLAFVRAWMKLVLWGLRHIMGVHVQIRGAEHIPQGPGLIAAKHQSMLDTVAPYALLKHPTYVLKQELMKLPVYGRLARASGMIPVDRAAHARALKQLVTDSRRALAEGRQIVIFPEGTRKEPSEPPDYKPGVAALYRDLGVPVTPMATNSGEHWPAHGHAYTPGVVVFEFLEPIPAGLKRRVFMEELERRIEDATAKLANSSPGPR